MFRYLFLSSLLLAACDTASPHFWGSESKRVTVSGSTFDVRRRGRLAEAIRINAQYAPRLGPIARRAELAIEHVTGCPVKELRGDQAVIIGILKCGGRDDIAKIARRPDITLRCDAAAVSVDRVSGTLVIDADCY
jgi:hypothetical protein